MAITRVQSKAIATGGASMPITFTATGSGNLLVIIAAGGQNTVDAAFTGPTGWTAIGPHNNDIFTFINAEAWYLPNCSAGLTSATVTATSNTNPNNATVLIFMEFSGAATTTPLDTSVLANSTANSTSLSKSLTTTASGDVLIGCTILDQAVTTTTESLTEPSGWTAVNSNTQDVSQFLSVSTAYEVVGAAGSYTYNPTWNVSTDWIVFYLAFKAAAGGGSAWNQALSDKQSALDTRLGQVQRPVTGDTQSGTDVSVRQAQKLAADVTSGADFTGKTATKPATDAQSGVDSSTRAPQKALSDSQSALDAFSHLWSAHLALSEAISGLDSVQKSVLVPLLEAFSDRDAVSTVYTPFTGQAWKQNLSDAFSETDLLASWTLVKLLGDAYSGVDVRTGQVGHALYDVLSGNDALLKQIQHAVAEVTSAVDKVTAGKTLLLTLLDQASLLDIPMTSYTKIQFGLLAMLTSLVASALGMSATFANTSMLGLTMSLLTSLAVSTTLLPY